MDLAFLLVPLAGAGFFALLVRLGVSLLLLGVRAAESTAAGGLAELSERRGDVTGMMERREAAGRMRRSRRRAGLSALVWTLLLVVPPLAGAALEAYAAASLLWFLPRRRAVVPAPARPDES